MSSSCRCLSGHPDATRRSTSPATSRNSPRRTAPRPVRWDRENGSLWRIYAKGETHLTVRYRVFANTLSGTFSVLDTAHANWNGPSIFMYVVDHKPDPVRLHIAAPAGWHIINGDSRTADQTDYLFREL